MTFVFKHPSKYIKLGKKSGPPPKSGPQSEGLNYDYNTVKTVRLEKTNGRHRKSTSKRS
jgi:hypothetical protein